MKSPITPSSFFTLRFGRINPLRYRSYYYDRETRLYYLQSRYYDFANCRFKFGLDTGGKISRNKMGWS